MRVFAIVKSEKSKIITRRCTQFVHHLTFAYKKPIKITTGTPTVEKKDFVATWMLNNSILSFFIFQHAYIHSDKNFSRKCLKCIRHGQTRNEFISRVPHSSLCSIRFKVRVQPVSPLKTGESTLKYVNKQKFAKIKSNSRYLWNVKSAISNEVGMY